MQVEGGGAGGGRGVGGQGLVWDDLLGGPSSPGRPTTPRGRAGVLGGYIFFGYYVKAKNILNKGDIYKKATIYL